MRNPIRRTIFSLSVCAAMLCAFAAGSASRRALAVAAEKAIKKDEARKLIAAASLLELNKEAVTIKEISPPGMGATVLAGVKLGFRFVRDEAGAWRVVEVRTGDRQWESFDLLARALDAERIAHARAELDAFAAALAALAENKSANAAEAKSPTAADAKTTAAGDAPASQAADNARDQTPKELRRGALSVKNPEAALAPSGSSAVVELEVETSVDFARDARGRWQVARVRVGGGDGRGFEAFDAFARALDTEKQARARADLENLAAALEEYRRARGFYVVAETASDLVNHLNPRYTAAFIRFDPWHRPYEYEGTRERFTLRSLGADGKADTADDVTIRKG
ncbi:MAG TPA: type II secretion system protein GspG [Pyrinomonadaceae bacterium]|nr:type II secretion system protein GspG [Pyrinomonadaceae bacterium]